MWSNLMHWDAHTLDDAVWPVESGSVQPNQINYYFVSNYINNMIAFRIDIGRLLVCRGFAR